MFNVQFTPRGKKDLEKLPKDVQLRIIKKVTFFSAQSDLLTFSKPLINLPPATHRFRVGNYRIAFYISSKTLYIERIGHRREIYLD